MHVTHKRIFTTTKYRLCDKELEKVDHHPSLGVELSKNLKWNQHVHNTSCKANRMLGLLRRNLYKVPAIGEGNIRKSHKTESRVLRISMGPIHNDQHR